MKKLFTFVVAFATAFMPLASAPVHAATTVYTTATGTKYHFSKSCRGLSRARNIYTTTLAQAKSEGLSPCKICASGSAASSSTKKRTTKKKVASKKKSNYSVSYLGNTTPNKNAYKKVNGNRPTFKKSQMKTKSFEKYSSLDSLGRCGTAFACVSKSTMPTSKRGSIGMVKPTGWHTVRYTIVGKGSAGYLYNRCHLIAYELTGENANTRNLITGTRYLNIEGMLPFENKVAGYVKATGNHVLYRVKPDFKGKELVARGVNMEAYSVEDHGKGIKFNVYCYNKQPGIKINYKNGASSVA